MNVFTDIPQASLPDPNDKVNGQDYINNLFGMSLGAGSQVFRADEQGIWLGASKFEDAPFSVDMAGNLYALSAIIGGYASDDDLTALDNAAIKKAVSGQTLTGTIRVGANNIVIDGVNKRIIINDGTTDRILLGYQAGGF